MKLIFVLSFFVCGSVWAAEIQPDMPMLKEVLEFLQDIPYIGKYVKLALEVISEKENSHTPY